MSDALQQRLERAARSLRFAIERREEGRIVRAGDGVARARGLSSVGLDELVYSERGVAALAMDLREHDVGLVLLDEAGDVRVGDVLRASGTVVAVPAGEELLGRVVDPLGRPLDGLPPPACRDRVPIERPAPGVAERQPVTEPLFTGTTVVDTLFPIGRGQRQLILGDRGTGKTTLAIDAVLAQRDSGVRCVYVLIGEKASGVVALLETLRSRGALAHTIVVVAAADAPAGMRFIAPYAGMAMGEHFRDEGESSLVVFDDLTRHAIAYREISLLLERPAGREAYPGDIFYLHSRLLERATHLEGSLGGGSLTALPIAETQAGRISDYIPTNLISITDGQLYLDPLQFDQGFKPAVDVGLSVSRVGGRTQRASMRGVAATLRLEAARYREVEVFSRFGARLEESTQRLLARGARIREALTQTLHHPIGPGEQVAMIIAITSGALDTAPVESIRARLADLRSRLRAGHSGLVRKLELGQPPSDEDRRAIDAELSAGAR